MASPKKQPRKKLSGKGLTRLVTTLVFVLSTGLVGLTVWLFANTLSEVAQSQLGGSNPPRNEIDGELLKSLTDFHASRTGAAPLDPTRHGNPFLPVTPIGKESPPATNPIAPPANGAGTSNGAGVSTGSGGTLPDPGANPNVPPPNNEPVTPIQPIPEDEQLPDDRLTEPGSFINGTPVP